MNIAGPLKKLSLLVSAIPFLTFGAVETFADVQVQVTPPTDVGLGTTAPTTVLSNGFRIIFLVAAIVVLFMLIIGAFQWITSGGEKENVAKARGRITHALIGLAILALAVLIVTVVGGIFNINPFNIHCLPSLNSTGSGCGGGAS